MEKKKNLQMNVSQKVVLYDPQEKKILVVCDSQPDSEASKKYGSWELPGGHIEEGEVDLIKALKREIGEELGENIQYELGKIVGAAYLQLEENSRVNVIYLAKYHGGKIALSDEHVEYRWNTLEEVARSEEYRPHLKEIVSSASAHIQADEFLNDLKRIQADFDNYKKRQAAEKDEFSRYMINTIVTELVPVLDNFNMAISHVPSDKKDDPWVTGMTYIEKQFEEVLSRYGVKVLEAKAGDPFDPTKHEAIEHRETKDAESKDLIIEKVLQNGYIMGDKVVKAAKVNVTNK